MKESLFALLTTAWITFVSWGLYFLLSPFYNSADGGRDILLFLSGIIWWAVLSGVGTIYVAGKTLPEDFR